MKKFISLIITFVFTFTMIAGCGADIQPPPVPLSEAPASDNPQPSASPVPSPSPDNVQVDTPPAKLSGTISTNGSTSVEKVLASLIEAFAAEHPDVFITYDPTGSGAGITAATEGVADIGLSSRALKDSETGLDATIFALDGIAIIVNNSNAVTNLSIEQIAGLFTGEITNWNEVGGANSPVAIIGREGGSGTRSGFEEIMGVVDKCVYDQELTSGGAIITAVASNEYAIGYTSLSAVGDQVSAVSVNGITCSEATVKDGTYAVQRPFVMVTQSGRELSPEVKAFIEFALSSDAAEIIANAGAVQPPN